MFPIISLPSFDFALDNIDPAKKTYLLVAGGRQPDGQWLEQMASGKIIVCADRGVSYCKTSGIIPHFLLGDGDSAGEDFDWAEQNGVQTKKYAAYKDWTDLQLALDFIAQQQDVGMLFVTGIWGGRFDHAYSALFSVLAYSRLASVPALLLDQEETMFLFAGNGQVTIHFTQTPAAISVLPLCEHIRVSLQGCEWPLENSIVKQSNPYAVSNCLKIGQTGVNFALHEGCGGLYFCFQGRNTCFY